MSESTPLRVVHSIPGRLRVRVEAEDDGADELALWEDRLKGLPGVREVTSNRGTQSLLVIYDHSVSDPASSLGIRRISGERVHAPAAGSGAGHKTAPTPASRLLARRFWEMDRSLSDRTGGRVDLKLAIPATLMGFALFELVTGAEIAAATFHTLTWYAYNLFIHLHPEITVAVEEDGVRSEEEVIAEARAKTPGK